MDIREYGETVRTTYNDGYIPSEPECKETLKMKLENMGEILNELYNQVDVIENAVIGPRPLDNTARASDKDQNILQTINDLRDRAETILKTVLRIRGCLW